MDVMMEALTRRLEAAVGVPSLVLPAMHEAKDVVETLYEEVDLDDDSSELAPDDLHAMTEDTTLPKHRGAPSTSSTAAPSEGLESVVQNLPKKKAAKKVMRNQHVRKSKDGNTS